MTVTIGINGFGRIGRATLAHIAESARNDVQVVKLNATGPIETNAHLLRYDSVHGRFPGEVRVSGDTMDLGRGPMKVFSTYDPNELDPNTTAMRLLSSSVACDTRQAPAASVVPVLIPSYPSIAKRRLEFFQSTLRV